MGTRRPGIISRSVRRMWRNTLDKNKGAVEQPCCTMWFPPLPLFLFSPAEFLISTRCDARRHSQPILTHQSGSATIRPLLPFLSFSCFAVPYATIHGFFSPSYPMPRPQSSTRCVFSSVFFHPTRTFECRLILGEHAHKLHTPAGT